MPRKNPGHLKIAKPKGPELPKITHPVLNRKRVTSKGMEKYKKALLAALSTYLLPEAFTCLRQAMADGDIKAAEQILKSFEVLKSPGMTVNQNNNNVAQTEVVGGFRNFDTFIRDRAISKGMVLDVPAAIEGVEEEVANLPQLEEFEED
jgi:hypothetical protein